MDQSPPPGPPPDSPFRKGRRLDLDAEENRDAGVDFVNHCINLLNKYEVANLEEMLTLLTSNMVLLYAHLLTEHDAVEAWDQVLANFNRAFPRALELVKNQEDFAKLTRFHPRPN